MFDVSAFQGRSLPSGFEQVNQSNRISPGLKLPVAGIVRARGLLTARIENPGWDGIFSTSGANCRQATSLPGIRVWGTRKVCHEINHLAGAPLCRRMETRRLYSAAGGGDYRAGPYLRRAAR